MPFVANDGLQIAYDVTGRGAGPGFLFAQRKVGWARMGYVDALSSRGKVLVVDPRGFGDSSRCRSGADYSLDAFCDDLLAAADAVGLRPLAGLDHQTCLEASARVIEAALPSLHG